MLKSLKELSPKLWCRLNMANREKEYPVGTPVMALRDKKQKDAPLEKAKIFGYLSHNPRMLLVTFTGDGATAVGANEVYLESASV
jgi:hypothetical protein